MYIELRGCLITLLNYQAKAGFPSLAFFYNMELM